MIQWHAEAQKDWKEKSEPLGKNMRSWADPETWNALGGVFAHFEAVDSWQCLTATMNLFRRLSQEVALLLKVSYPETVDRHISAFISSLKG
jgi:hypothetical protein